MMKTLNLAGQSSESLVDLYIEIALKQDGALQWDKINKYNELFDVRHAIHDELQSRPSDHRRLLLPLLNHENPLGVRNAAEDAHTFDRSAAITALEAIVAEPDGYYSVHADFALDFVKYGPMK